MSSLLLPLVMCFCPGFQQTVNTSRVGVRHLLSKSTWGHRLAIPAACAPLGHRMFWPVCLWPFASIHHAPLPGVLLPPRYCPRPPSYCAWTPILSPLPLALERVTFLQHESEAIGNLDSEPSRQLLISANPLLPLNSPQSPRNQIFGKQKLERLLSHFHFPACLIPLEITFME